MRSDHPSAASHQAAGKYYLMVRQFDEAKKEFTAALALEPQNAKIHNDLGAVLLEEGRAQSSAADNSRQLELYGRSVEHIQKALELDNSLQEALFNRALVFQFMKSFRTGQRSLERVSRKKTTALVGQKKHEETSKSSSRNNEKPQRAKTTNTNCFWRLFVTPTTMARGRL